MGLVASDPASLQNLHDIFVSDPVPLWPPAPGWFILAAVILFGLFGIGWNSLKRWRSNAYRRAALAELDRLGALVQAPTKRGAALRALPELIKRVALNVYPRKKVATLSGAAWLDFLDHTGSTDAFTRGPGRLLPVISYQPDALDAIDASQTNELFQAVRHWVQYHSAQRATKLDG